MSEVEALSTSGIVEECTSFGDSTFRYVIKSSPEVDGLQASFDDNTISMLLPEAHARGWAKSARIGFENSVALDGGKQLSLLLEKDFTCLDETGEDQSDNYPNPKAGEKD